jgi:hypothetical protein
MGMRSVWPNRAGGIAEVAGRHPLSFSLAMIPRTIKSDGPFFEIVEFDSRKPLGWATSVTFKIVGRRREFEPK